MSEVSTDHDPYKNDPPQHNLSPGPVEIDSLAPLGRATRKHSKSQIRKIARSLETFGQVLPILLTDDARIIAGEGLVAAARHIGLTTLQAVLLTNLDAVSSRQLRLALNRLEDDGEWDQQELRFELEELVLENPMIDLTLSGFETAEIDLILSFDQGDEDGDQIPEIDPRSHPVSAPGDLWLLGPHRLLCGSAREVASYARLMGDDMARAMIADSPYNVCIKGHVGGKGTIQHREFVEASGELSDEGFESFLREFLEASEPCLIEGGLAYIFMDWRQMDKVLRLGRAIYDEFKNLCVWVKNNGGMGSFYRSQHELVGIFKKGKAQHINNVELGRHGRNRTNVWAYAGVNSFGQDRMEDLAMHPTVKPLAMIADAILDCSARGDLILDPFVGSGTTLVAAEQTGRLCAAMELDPLYVDTTIRRWQGFTGREARNAETGLTFAESESRQESDAEAPAGSSMTTSQTVTDISPERGGQKNG